jgi:hypothetical protein
MSALKDWELFEVERYVFMQQENIFAGAKVNPPTDP